MEKNNIILIGVLLLLSLFGILGYISKGKPINPKKPDVKPVNNSTNIIDPNSYSNLHEVTTEHIKFFWIVDFEQKTINGAAGYKMKIIENNVTSVIYDINSVNIISVKKYIENNDGNATHEDLKFEIRTNNATSYMGQALYVYLDRSYNQNEIVNIEIDFTTSTMAEALSWMTPEQTGGKTQPYLFSQCEPISCRSIMPLQDTPSIKFTYDGAVQASDKIDVFMSANKTATVSSQNNTKIHYFNCTMPIPSYLIAIVAGNVTRKAIGKRSGVITEPVFIDAYAKELEDLDTYLDTIEEYIGTYRWGTYNIVILPPSFPMGGMENPLLTFASPSIIVGDKSGVFVAIHEIAHSWTGNLVTCKNWENIWINEGFTVYLERKASQKLFGQEFYLVDAYEGNVTLNNDIASNGKTNEFTKLHPNMTNKDPNAAWSTLPYEKGFQFLAFIESVVGEENLRMALKYYISQHAESSVDYFQFKNDFLTFMNTTNITTEQLSKIDWNAWVEQPGYTPVPLFVDSEQVRYARYLAVEIVKKGVKPDYNMYLNFTAITKRVFYETLIDLSDNVTASIIDSVYTAFKVSTIKDFELLQRWYTLTTAVKYTNNYKEMGIYLSSIGREKMIVPVYTNLAKYDINQAKAYYEQNKNFYHPLAAKVIYSIVYPQSVISIE